MNCPVCGAKTRVPTSTPVGGGLRVARVRVCQRKGCEHAFTTHEIPDDYVMHARGEACPARPRASGGDGGAKGSRF